MFKTDAAYATSLTGLPTRTWVPSLLEMQLGDVFEVLDVRTVGLPVRFPEELGRHVCNPCEPRQV